MQHVQFLPSSVATVAAVAVTATVGASKTIGTAAAFLNVAFNTVMYFCGRLWLAMCSPGSSRLAAQLKADRPIK